MLDNVEVLIHSSIKINKGLVIYFDPYKINKDYNDADIVFITHSHYDHYSEDDLKKVIKDNTIIVIPSDLEILSNTSVLKPMSFCGIPLYIAAISPLSSTNPTFNPLKLNFSIPVLTFLIKSLKIVVFPNSWRRDYKCCIYIVLF